MIASLFVYMVFVMVRCVIPLVMLMYMMLMALRLICVVEWVACDNMVCGVVVGDIVT